MAVILLFTAIGHSRRNRSSALQDANEHVCMSTHATMQLKVCKQSATL